MNKLALYKELDDKEYIIRSEFMKDFIFEGKDFKYLSNYIYKNINTNNSMFLTDLIYFASKINITSSRFQKIIESLLLSDTRCLVKLAILDYFVELEFKHLDSNYERLLLTLEKKRNFKIVRNQIFFNLIMLNNKSIEVYYNNLRFNLEKTDDWRSIYRTLANFKDVESAHFINYKNEIILHIKKLNKLKKFGLGVQEILKQF